MKKRILILFILFIVALIFTGFFYLIPSEPLQGKLSITGIEGAVSIYRDSDGIPHINAEKNDVDAFFALGFIHAEDRFWQMEFQRRVASGTLSEIFGKKTVETDKYLRTWGFYRAAELAWPALDKPTQAIIKSYTAGVNEFIKRGNFPIEIKILHYHPKPWSVIDSIAWQKMMAWNLQSHSWLNKIDYTLLKNKLGEAQISHYFPDYPKDAPLTLSSPALTVIKRTSNNLSISSNLLTNLAKNERQIKKNINLPASSGLGSNGWVLDGKKTLSGKPLLANDIHLALSAPNLWYLVELRGPTLHVIGATIPGLPAVAIGHNDTIAWGVTNGYNDAAELYLLNKHEPLTHYTEEIKVRHAESIRLPILMSQYGPVISTVTPQLKSFSEKIALKWPALMPADTTIQSFIKINYAKNWSAFEAALKDFISPTQNFLYADRMGNIGFYYPGRLPDRQWKSLTIAPASTLYQWHHFIPFSQLPHQYNPSTDYIASANNKVISDQYPFQLNARWPIPPYRIERITQLLDQKKLFSINDMAHIQSDTTSQLWLRLKPYLLQVKPQDHLSQIALDRLRLWSGDMIQSRIEPTIFAYWLNTLNALTPSFLQHQEKIIEPLYLENYLKNNTSSVFLQKSLQAAMQNLSKELGNNEENWKWGNNHQADFVANGLGKINLLKLIWNRSIATSGGEYTVNVGGYDPATLRQNKGATYREIIDLSNFDHSLYMIPMGQSGNPFSKHYSDLLHRWRDRQYIQIPSTSACQVNSKNCLVLVRKDSGSH